MNRQVRKGFMLSFVLLCLWAFSVFAQTDSRKITVRVPGATIHARADSSSEVIEKPSVGTAYEVVAKTGEWYEIKLPSSLGMVITGFINEKFLNIEKPAVEPQANVVQTAAGAVSKQPARAIKFNFSLGGLYNIQAAYDYKFTFTYADEKGAIYDYVDNQNMFGVRLGVGFFILENIEVTLGLQYTAATLAGIYALDLPNDSIYNDIAHAEAPADHAISEIAMNLGLNLHVLNEGPLRPYGGGGVAFVSGKIELLKDFSYLNVYYIDKTHSVTISDPKLSSETISALGFYGKAGIDIIVSEVVAVFGEGQYLYAKKEAPHPFGTTATGSDDPVEINLGGISVLFGVKIRL
ncbi:MAG: outer membrane beta-barrel protein [Methanosarcinaceae archaeon]|nr:outer membrane beta-barrel protein [Methanosarcinaceae archaeon]